MTRKQFSSLYKDGGVQVVTPGVSGLSPLAGKTGQLLTRRDARMLYGKTPLIAAVDPNLSDRQVRIISVLAVHVWHDLASLSYSEIGWAVNCSERQAKRDVKALEAQSYLEVRRTGNRANEYEINSPVFIVPAKTVATPASAVVRYCGTCGKPAKRLNTSGVCYTCADVDRWRVARLEAGKEASIAQVGQLLDLKRITKRWARVARRAEKAA